MEDRTIAQAGTRRWLGWLAGGLGGLSVLAIVLLIFTVAGANAQRDRALEEQRRSFGIMLLARSLESALTDSEATLGRYVISGDKDVGRDYFAEWRRAGAILERLRRQVSRDPAQLTLIDALRETYRKRGRELAATALRTNYGQNWNALGTFYQTGQAASLSEMSDGLERLIRTERANLIARSDEAEALVASSNRMAVYLSLFGVVLIGAAGALAWATVRAVGQRREADRDVEQVVLRADALESAVEQRTAELSEANARLRAEAMERAAAEAQLRQVQKMEAVGKLTGGIAHDFNNMLAVVTGGLELARRRLDDAPGDAARHIDHAMEGATRAGALTRRLLAFSRAEPLLPGAHRPAAVVAALSELIDRMLGEGIAIETRGSDAAWLVWVDRHQLENALLNLAVNARDAMNGRGRLVLGTADREIAAGEMGELPPGDYAMIEVADEGCGIAPEVLDRVFEPFFTTKPVGEGTGLGLAQVFGFARAAGGHVEIRSKPGIGTTVSILLPRHADQTVAAVLPAAATAPSEGKEGESRTILVVEDDPRVLVSTVEVLRELGHHPIPCPRPTEAEALLAKHREIELILSDVMMPEITGPELVARLTRTRPDIGVVFVTGFTGDAAEADFGGRPVLRKPFTIAGLARAVDRAGRAPVSA